MKIIYTKIIGLFVSFLLIFTSSSLALTPNSFSKDSEDVLILAEENTIEILGKAILSMHVYISKKVTYKINNTAGIEKVNKLVLPETFDPSYISHHAKARKHTYAFSSLKCEFIKGTITRTNGEVVVAEISSTIEPVEMLVVENMLYGNFEKLHYQIDNLQAGDVVSLEYKYNFPYRENVFRMFSFRVFFHNDIYKEKYSLTVRHNPKLDFELTTENKADIDSSSLAGKVKEYRWEEEKLMGCISEQGSHPYRTLPHIVFSPKPVEFLYTLPNSVNQEFIPFYALYARLREKRHIKTANSILQGVNTRQLTQIYRFVKNETLDIQDDSLGIYKLQKINNTITDNFTFQDDIKYFKGYDMKDAKMGDNITKMNLRDISRYELYSALILKLDLSYFTTYLCDNRVGQISNNYFFPMYESDYLLASVMKDNTIHYIYPKKSSFGYYLDEIPFYYENAVGRLVHLNDYNDRLKPISTDERLVKLPTSNLKNNVRKSNVQVQINLDSLSIDFDASIRLMGQFSTLTRGVYQYNELDETINDCYHQKLWDINDSILVKNKKVEVKKKVFPYTTNVKASYSSNDLLISTDSSYTLDLSNWFNHIYYKDFSAVNRQLDFYTDFTGKDAISYAIEFDKDIELIGEYQNFTINNEFGAYSFMIQQVKPNTIKVASFFTVKNGTLGKDQVQAVEHIYTKIQELEKFKLNFKLL